MRVIALKTLRDFIVQHPSSKPALLAWYEEAGKAKWQKPMDIKKQFANASFVGQNRVIFNIKGNDYRLIVAIAYRLGQTVSDGFVVLATGPKKAELGPQLGASSSLVLELPVKK